MWASRSKWAKPPTPRTPTPTRSPIEPGSPSSRGRRGQGATNPHPLPLARPLLYPSLQQHAPPPPNATQGRKNGEGGEETGQGERDEPRRVTGQGRPRSPKTVQSAEGEEGKENGKESLWLLEAPVRKIILQMHTPARSSQCWSQQTPAWTWSVHLDAPGQRHRQQPRLRDGQPPE